MLTKTNGLILVEHFFLKRRKSELFVRTFDVKIDK